MNAVGIRLLAVLGDGIDAGTLRDALPPAATLSVVRLDEQTDRDEELTEGAAPSLVLIGCSAYSEPALRVIRRLNEVWQDCPVVVVYPGNPNGFMESAFAAGAEDVVDLRRSPDDLAFAIEKVIARRRGSAGAAAASPMICVLGPKGGTGKTLVSCNLAVALATAGARAVVVDLDLQFGDVGLALGLRPDRTIHDLAMSGGALDGEKVDGFLLEHPSGARALLAPTRPDQAAAIGIPFLRRLFEVLRSRYDFVVVDTPPAFSPEVIAAIDMSTHLCMVGMLDALSLKDTKVALETLRQMGYDPDDTTLVLNRADSRVGISHGDVEQLLEKTPDVLVPSDLAVPKSITVGEAVVAAEPRSGPARALTALAQRYLEARVERTTTPDLREPRQRPRRRVLLKKGR